MIVVSDTSPILYLLLIHQIDLLPRLYDQVIIPEIVRTEMQASGAPILLQTWIAHPPTWLKIRDVSSNAASNFQRLDPGEQAAIALALSLNADLLLIDDRNARQIAKSLGLRITGLLGILGSAAQQNMIDFPSVLNQLLQETNFRASPQLIQDLIDRFS